MPKKIHEEKILTLNVNGKKGVNITKSKYKIVKKSIISNLEKHKLLTMADLSELVKQELGEDFDGKIGWYFMAVKLDLEARKEIERLVKIKPQTLQITAK